MSFCNRTDIIKPEFPEMLRKHMGIVSAACQSAGITRDTYYRWRKADQEFADACDEAYDYTGDFVENQLLNLIKNEDTSATIFYCKTKLKNRGYSEKHEHEHYGNKDKDSILQNVTHTIVEEDANLLELYHKKRLLKELHGSNGTSSNQA